MVEFEEPETHDKLQIDASGFRPDYLAEVRAFCDRYRRECFQVGIDYVGLDTSMQFDRALTEYLVSRQSPRLRRTIESEFVERDGIGDSDSRTI